MSDAPHAPTPPATAAPASRGDDAPWYLRPAILAVCLNVCAFAILAVFVIVQQVIPHRPAYDQKYYHEPTIRGFAEQLPALDLWDYLSATTPGYHILQALVVRLVSGQVWVLQSVNALITAGLIGLLTYAVTRRLEERHEHTQVAGERTLLLGVVLAGPMVTSMYIFQSGVFLLPDNTSWLLVLGVLLLALRPTWGVRTCALAGVLLLMLVLVRQLHAWAAGLLWVSAWLGAAGAGVAWGQAGTSLREMWWTGRGPRLRRLALALACSLPAVVLLGLFVRYWGGLVPPRFAGQLSLRDTTLLERITTPAPALTLALVGAFGMFLVAWWAAPLLRQLRRRPGVVLLWGLGALLLATIPATTLDPEAGRSTGLWNVARISPVVLGHSNVLVVALAVLGGVVLGALVHAQRSARDAWVLLAALAGVTLALSTSQLSWQRYIEAVVLFVLALLVSGTVADGADGRPAQGNGAEGDADGWARLPRGSALVRWTRLMGPAALVVFYGSITLTNLQMNASRISDPPPPVKDNLGHIGAEPPVLLPRPEKPAGWSFWPW